MGAPLVSVILPAYNAEKYIEAAITSILTQTYKNLELIVINDGSSDKTEEVVKNISDPRLRYFRQDNCGLACTLNKAIELSNGEFIARQDADDISLPERIKKQVQFLSEHPDHGVVGTWARIIDADGKENGKVHAHVCNKDEIKFYLLFDNPIVHSSVMFRKQVVERCGVYNEKLNALTQDFEYWHRISLKFSLANLPEYLQWYRQLGTGISFSTSDFSCTVAQQAAHHIAGDANLNMDQALLLANAYHGCGRVHGRDKEIESIFQSVSKVLPVELREKISAPHLFHLRRSLYNAVIDDPAATAFQRLRYRMKRKLLFMKFAS